jgi:hypothetical protein
LIQFCYKNSSTENRTGTFSQTLSRRYAQKKKPATFNIYKRVTVPQAPEEIKSISKKHLLTQD